MKNSLLVALVLLAGCARELQYKFVRTDRNFTPSPHPELPRILVDLKEIYGQPPMRAVGVVQVIGPEKKTINQFLGRIAEVGAKLGCDGMMQADLFELDPRIETLNPVRNPAGVFWVAGDEAAWQFVCGVKGASDFEAAATYDYALVVAAAIRDAQFRAGLCDRHASTGSHVPNWSVCAEMKGLAGRTIGLTSLGGSGGGPTKAGF